MEAPVYRTFCELYLAESARSFNTNTMMQDCRNVLGLCHFPVLHCFRSSIIDSPGSKSAPQNGMPRTPHSGVHTSPAPCLPGCGAGLGSLLNIKSPLHLDGFAVAFFINPCDPVSNPHPPPRPPSPHPLVPCGSKLRTQHDKRFGSRDTELRGQGTSEATIPCSFIPRLYTAPGFHSGPRVADMEPLNKGLPGQPWAAARLCLTEACL